MENKAKVTETAFKTHGYTIVLVYLKKVNLIAGMNFVMFSEMNFVTLSSISVYSKKKTEKRLVVGTKTSY